MHILTLIGARPQFVKAAMVSQAFQEMGITERIVHSGQHYDVSMDRIFFEQLRLPAPAVNLGVGSGTPNFQVGEMLIRLEQYLLSLSAMPKAISVYGDTNTTLAGALVASKLRIPLVHIEAGLRSFNRNMPEEINRIITDRLATWNFCPTETAVQNLRQEGISADVFLVGDVMLDATQHYATKSLQQFPLVSLTSLPQNKFYLATVHRAENTDNLANLQAIFEAFQYLDFPVLLPLHPRTKALLDALPSSISLSNIHILPPVGYFEMLTLIQSCAKVLTDSGGLQKEAYWLKKQTITLRNETEWIETVHGNWNVCVGANTSAIVDAVNTSPHEPQRRFGRIDERWASQHIAQEIKKHIAS